MLMGGGGPEKNLFGHPTTIRKTSQVFVPGGMPSLTYVQRTERDLETRLASVNDNLCKLVTLTGSTKSGKTVLANRIFQRGIGSNVWVDGGTVRSEEDLWTTILGELDGATESEDARTNEFGGGVAVDAHGEARIPLVAKGGLKAGGSVNAKTAHSKKRSLAKTPRAAALAELRRTKSPLIIDDFHYFERSLQGSVVRALKPLIFEGQPVVCIAIPHRRYDVVKVEKEMTGRLEPIEVPTWTLGELIEIAKTGFPLLNVKLAPQVAERMASEAYGSPHLMQEFGRKLADYHNVKETKVSTLDITSVSDEIFRSISADTGKVIFDKLKKGPRQRSDRKARPLVGGGTADVYEAVLQGLAALSPGLQRVDYEQLRAAIRSVLADDFPQAHEVSRVLEKMSEIASSDEASTPVLDWDKEERQLHVTDPFFAFFLKWGLKSK
jgi:hypothetical protein